jgi:hypothetical protein
VVLVLLHIYADELTGSRQFTPPPRLGKLGVKDQLLTPYRYFSLPVLSLSLSLSLANTLSLSRSRSLPTLSLVVSTS